MSRLAPALLAASLLLLGACGRPVAGKTARGFVEIQDDPSYDFRAVAPEGVAVAARVVRLTKRDDVGFWERAVALRMRELEGYELMETKDVRSPDGASGRELFFGHDEDGKPYVYRVRLFVLEDRLIVIESGGYRAEVAKMETSLEWMMGQLRTR